MPDVNGADQNVEADPGGSRANGAAAYNEPSHAKCLVRAQEGDSPVLSEPGTSGFKPDLFRSAAMFEPIHGSAFDIMARASPTPSAPFGRR
jgi:hypothetical protein